MKLNCRFNLRRQNSKRPEKVYLIVRWAGNKFVYPTSYNILPKHWNGKTYEVRNVIDEPNRDEINNYLKDLKTETKRIYETGIAQRQTITKDLLKTGLDLWTGKTVIEKATFWNWLAKFIEASKTRINPKTGRVISYRTIQEYNTTFDVLKAFEKENREQLEFDTISLQTISDFRDFLTSVKGYSVNNIAKHIDNFRQFLRAAQLEKIPFEADVINPRLFKAAREQAQDIYLTPDELKRIEAVKLDTQNGYDRARDLFLIGCYTGLRVSDYNNLKPYNIKGDKIDLIQHKTGGRVVIPIHQTVKAILSKYGGNTPPKLSDQKINDYIKDVGKRAGIVEKVGKQQTKGGKLVNEVYEKWQLITTHTARRSFATNAIRAGIPTQSVMKITGHKKESVFLKYVKLSETEHAEIVAKYWNAAPQNEF
ncbi:MAG: tyrosine-type recombinase/integrase [Bacteroidetes bacterium]|nr:tyrosine-type recombinase/integrase [Bacteroidota bacterium]